MSPAAVSARLRTACQPPTEVRSCVPMDAASVTARLRSVSELRELCLKLGRGRVVDSTEPSSQS